MFFGDLVYFEDMLSDQSQFFLVRSIGVIPLSVIGQAVAEGAIAGHPIIGSQATGRHEGVSEVDKFGYSVYFEAEMDDPALPVKLHLLLRAESLLDEISG